MRFFVAVMKKLQKLTIKYFVLAFREACKKLEVK